MCRKALPRSWGETMGKCNWRCCCSGLDSTKGGLDSTKGGLDSTKGGLDSTKGVFFSGDDYLAILLVTFLGWLSDSLNG